MLPRAACVARSRGDTPVHAARSRPAELADLAPTARRCLHGLRRDACVRVPRPVLHALFRLPRMLRGQSACSRAVLCGQARRDRSHTDVPSVLLPPTCFSSPALLLLWSSLPPCHSHTTALRATCAAPAWAYGMRMSTRAYARVHSTRTCGPVRGSWLMINSLGFSKLCPEAYRGRYRHEDVWRYNSHTSRTQGGGSRWSD